MLATAGLGGAWPNEKTGRLQGSVIGVVFDSMAMRPLAGASVQMLRPGGERHTTVSDSAGVFRIAGLPPGQYLIAFSHAALDSLGLEFRPNTLNIAEEETLQTRLAIPSARGISRLLCPAAENAQGTGALIGFVRSAADRVPLGASSVFVRFDDYIVSRRRVQRDSMGRSVVTQANGYFVVCGIPAGVTVLARAASGSDSSGYLELELPPNAALKRDLYVGRVTRIALPVDSAPEPPARQAPRTIQVLRGSGVLSGTVRQSDGRPISGARISVWGTGRDAETNAAGSFTIDSVPTGSHMIELRAIGFVPQREPADVWEGSPTAITVSMTPRQLFLDTVRVLATRAYASGRIAEFEQRRRSRIGGYFLDPDEIDRRNAASFTDLMRGTPTVAIDPDSRHGDQVRMVGASNENDPYCDPTIWIDGVRQPQRETSLNSLVFPERIVAIEGYSRTVESPLQFQSNSRCGVILVWTGERVRRRAAVPEKR